MGNSVKIYHEELGWGGMDRITLDKEGARGGGGNGIKDIMDTVPRNVGYQSSNDALQYSQKNQEKISVALKRNMRLYPDR